MRVAFDGRSLSSPVLRGWDRYTVGLVGELVRQGIEVTLFHRASEPLHTPHVAGLNCRVVGLRDRGGLYWEQVGLPLALWRERYDVFHAPAEHGVPLAAPCPVVLTIHSVTWHSYADMVRRGILPGRVRDYLGFNAQPNRRTPGGSYMQAQIARADHILTPSDFCRREVMRFLRVPPERVTVTPLAVHEQFRKPPSASEVRAATLARLRIHVPYLIYVGGYEPHKNVAGLLAAFADVRSQCPQLSLVLVGTKTLPDVLLARAESLHLSPHRDVRFLLNLTGELTDLYDAAEMFVSLSWRETFCLPALEAMTRGLPVVASAWGATPEVVGAAGALVDPRNKEDAVRTILQILSSTDGAVRRDCLKVRAGHFDWQSTASRTLAIYRWLLGRGKRMTG